MLAICGWHFQWNHHVNPVKGSRASTESLFRRCSGTIGRDCREGSKQEQRRTLQTSKDLLIDLKRLKQTLLYGKFDEALDAQRRFFGTPGPALSLMAKGRLDEAQPLLEAAVRKNSGDLRARGRLALLMALRGNLKEATDAVPTTRRSLRDLCTRRFIRQRLAKDEQSSGAELHLFPATPNIRCHATRFSKAVPQPSQALRRFAPAPGYFLSHLQRWFSVVPPALQVYSRTDPVAASVALSVVVPFRSVGSDTRLEFRMALHCLAQDNSNVNPFHFNSFMPSSAPRMKHASPKNL